MYSCYKTPQKCIESIGLKLGRYRPKLFQTLSAPSPNVHNDSTHTWCGVKFLKEFFVCMFVRGKSDVPDLAGEDTQGKLTNGTPQESSDSGRIRKKRMRIGANAANEFALASSHNTRALSEGQANSANPGQIRASGFEFAFANSDRGPSVQCECCLAVRPQSGWSGYARSTRNGLDALNVWGTACR